MFWSKWEQGGKHDAFKQIVRSKEKRVFWGAKVQMTNVKQTCFAVVFYNTF